LAKLVTPAKRAKTIVSTTLLHGQCFPTMIERLASCWTTLDEHFVKGVLDERLVLVKILIPAKRANINTRLPSSVSCTTTTERLLGKKENQGGLKEELIPLSRKYVRIC
jgi:hypothetical protein